MEQHKTYPIEVVPCITLASDARQFFTYQADRPLDQGTLVDIPFGPRKIPGVVWNSARESVPHIKEIARIREPLFASWELPWLERLAQSTLEPLSLIVKSAVAVRRVAKELSLPVQPSSRRAPAPDIVWQEHPLPPSSLFPEDARGQHLVLVPDRSWAQRLRDRLPAGKRVMPYSHAMPLTARRELIHGLMGEEDCLVLATQSGIFLPFARLASITIIESALSSHRQWDQHPRYDARVAALLRGQAEGVRVRFVSSLPSLDLDRLQGQGIRASGRLRMSSILLLRKPADATLFSKEAEESMRMTLDRGGNVLVYHNIVGSERVYACAACGMVLKCERCGTFLQRAGRSLSCPSCGVAAGPVRQFCPSCFSPRIHPRVIGTRAIGEELASRFPRTPHVRIDRETKQSGLVRNRTQGPSLIVGTDAVLSVVQEGSIDLVVVPDADVLLGGYGHDIAEHLVVRLWRLGQSTNDHREPRCLVQTSRPHLPFFRSFEGGEIGAWKQQEHADRRHLLFPPYAVLVSCERVFPSLTKARAAVREILEKLRAQKEIRTGSLLQTRKSGTYALVVIRGSQDAVWHALRLVPRSWSRDPFVPLAETWGNLQRLTNTTKKNASSARSRRKQS